MSFALWMWMHNEIVLAVLSGNRTRRHSARGAAKEYAKSYHELEYKSASSP